MFWGLKLLVPLTPGAQWKLRQDSKYGRPVSKPEFVASNWAHVQQLATSMKVDERTDTLRSEVRAEAAKGRFQGPWSLQWLSQRCEHEQMFAAKAFPILQGDKVRRGDDWRRSGHNSTVWASDAPYQGAPNIVSCICSFARVGQPTLAAVDHEGA